MTDSIVKEIVFVNKKCIETWPCKHEVLYIDYEDKPHTTVMSGLTIFKLIQGGKCKIDDNHFSKYQDVVE